MLQLLSDSLFNRGKRKRKFNIFKYIQTLSNYTYMLSLLNKKYRNTFSSIDIYLMPKEEGIEYGYDNTAVS